MVMLISLNSATSRGESATEAPYCASCSALVLVRLWTTRSWPASKRLPAMAAPMIPSPANPTRSAIALPRYLAHAPLHPAFEGVFLEREAAPFALEAYSVQRALLGEAEQPLGCGGLHAVDRELYLAPVHALGALG